MNKENMAYIPSDDVLTKEQTETIYRLAENPNVINCIYHSVEELHSAKCPHCGESYYMEHYSTTTALYYPPIYKDGVNINPDRNQTTTYCTCMNCGKDFSY